MTKLTEQSNIADIAAVYNELKGTDTDVKTLAKRGKAKLLAQIDALGPSPAEHRRTVTALAVDQNQGVVG